MVAEEDERQSAWVCFQRFSACQTVDLKTQTEEVNQGSDLDLLVGLVMSGAGLSSKQERVVL